jgi:hypothetical protein
MKLSHIAGIGALLLAVPFAAMAQDIVTTSSPNILGTTVVLPWGQWLAQQAMPTIGWVLGLCISGVVIWLGHRVGGPFADANVQKMETTILQRAVHVGVGAVEGASLRQEMKINVANAAFASGIQYLVQHEPALMKKYGIPKLRALLSAEFARLDSVPDAASADTLGSGVYSAPVHG